MCPEYIKYCVHRQGALLQQQQQQEHLMMMMAMHHSVPYFTSRPFTLALNRWFSQLSISVTKFT
jgi:Mg/Co/Ni transporter MgtE